MKIGRKTRMLGIVGATLIAATLGGTQLRAQMTASNGFDKPEAAATAFVVLLERVKKNPHALMERDALMARGIDPLTRLASDKDKKLMGRDGANRLMVEIFIKAMEPRFRTSIEKCEGNDAVVSVVPETQSENYPPVVCIQENGRWRINLIATYARWNNLDEKTALREISNRLQIPIAGVAVSDTLRRSVANARRGACQSNLKQIAFGMMQYTQDNDEKYPPADKWNDAIVPYVRSEQILHCPEVGANKYGYAMNWRISRKTLKSVKNLAQTATVYDSRTLKRSATAGGGKDIAFRHDGGANFACADGHVKFSRPKNVPNFLLNPNAKKPTAKPKK